MMKTSSALGEGVGEVGHLQILYFRNNCADCFCDGCRKVVPLKGLRCVLGVCGVIYLGDIPTTIPLRVKGSCPGPAMEDSLASLAEMLCVAALPLVAS